MKCPVCGKEMVQENFGVNVDVCENGCKGIWFDQGELRMLDENNEGLGAALENAAPWRNQSPVIIGPARSRQPEQTQPLGETALGIGVGVDKDMPVIEGAQ